MCFNQHFLSGHSSMNSLNFLFKRVAYQDIFLLMNSCNVTIRGQIQQRKADSVQRIKFKKDIEFEQNENVNLN
jgi:hypothetical protein